MTKTLTIEEMQANARSADDPQFLTLSEVSARWLLDRGGSKASGEAHLRRLIANGQLKAFRPSERKTLVSLEEVRRYEREGGFVARTDDGGEDF